MAFRSEPLAPIFAMMMAVFSNPSDCSVSVPAVSREREVICMIFSSRDSLRESPGERSSVLFLYCTIAASTSRRMPSCISWSFFCDSGVSE